MPIGHGTLKVARATVTILKLSAVVFLSLSIVCLVYPVVHSCYL